MKKTWVAAAAVVLVLAVGAGVAWKTGRLGAGGLAAASAGASADAKPGQPGQPGKGGKDGKDKPAPPLDFLPSEVVQPAMARLDDEIQFSGALVAPDTAVLRSKAAGTLLALTVREGDRLRAGQAVGKVDMAEAAARVTERQALLELARAQHAQAQRTLASNQRLADQQFISAQALDASRAAEETARAQVNAARAALESAQLALRDGALVAPLSGIVARRQVLPGEKVSMEQPVLTVVNLQRLELAGTVATHEVSRLQPGMALKVQVEGAGEPVAARIARIAPAAEAGTRSIGVTVELPNPQEKLRAGQYAVATVRLADETPRLTVPATAVSAQGGEQQVWLLKDNRLVRRTVVLGRRDERGGRVEVREGLAATDAVLAARFDNLRDGAQARLVNARPASGVAAAAPAASTAQR